MQTGQLFVTLLPKFKKKLFLTSLQFASLIDYWDIHLSEITRNVFNFRLFKTVRNNLFSISRRSTIFYMSSTSAKYAVKSGKIFDFISWQLSKILLVHFLKWEVYLHQQFFLFRSFQRSKTFKKIDMFDW